MSRVWLQSLRIRPSSTIRPRMLRLAAQPPVSRSFSNTAAIQHAKSELAKEHRDIPTYPYGASQLYKKSNFGLFAGARIRFGNIVSKGRWVKKTRRKWRPNVQRKRLYSEALGKFIQTKVTTRVLRTIDKAGGLDNYLLGNSPARIKDLGMKGWALRWKIMQTDAVKERFAAERKELGMNTQDFQRNDEELAQIKQIFLEEVQNRPSKRDRVLRTSAKHKRRDVWINPPVLEAYNKIVKSQLKLHKNLLRTDIAAIAEEDSTDKQEALAAIAAKAKAIKADATNSFNQKVNELLAAGPAIPESDTKARRLAKIEAQRRVAEEIRESGELLDILVAEHATAKGLRAKSEANARVKEALQEEVKRYEEFVDVFETLKDTRKSPLQRTILNDPTTWEQRDEAIRNRIYAISL